jgi:hypothetical protein
VLRKLPRDEHVIYFQPLALSKDHEMMYWYLWFRGANATLEQNNLMLHQAIYHNCNTKINFGNVTALPCLTLGMLCHDASCSASYECYTELLTPLQ